MIIFDVVGHVGTDGRRYLVDFGRALPAEWSQATTHLPTIGRPMFYRLLRPELLRILRSKGQLELYPPVCPDAFTNWCLDNREYHDATAKNATLFMLHFMIPRLARNLVGDLSKQVMAKACRSMSVALHRYGINCRHLGLLRATCLYPPQTLNQTTSDKDGKHTVHHHHPHHHHQGISLTHEKTSGAITAASYVSMSEYEKYYVNKHSQKYYYGHDAVAKGASDGSGLKKAKEKKKVKESTTDPTEVGERDMDENQERNTKKKQGKDDEKVDLSDQPLPSRYVTGPARRVGYVRTALLLEITGRSLKNLLRERLRAVNELSGAVSTHSRASAITAEFLNSITGAAYNEGFAAGLEQVIRAQHGLSHQTENLFFHLHDIDVTQPVSPDADGITNPCSGGLIAPFTPGLLARTASIRKITGAVTSSPSPLALGLNEREASRSGGGGGGGGPVSSPLTLRHPSLSCSFSDAGSTSGIIPQRRNSTASLTGRMLLNYSTTKLSTSVQRAFQRVKSIYSPDDHSFMDDGTTQGQAHGSILTSEGHLTTPLERQINSAHERRLQLLADNGDLSKVKTLRDIEEVSRVCAGNFWENEVLPDIKSRFGERAAEFIPGDPYATLAEAVQPHLLTLVDYVLETVGVRVLPACKDAYSKPGKIINFSFTPGDIEHFGTRVKVCQSNTSSTHVNALLTPHPSTLFS